MKKRLKRILKWLGLLLLIHIAGILGWRLLYGRGWGAASHVEPLDISYGFARGTPGYILRLRGC